MATLRTFFNSFNSRLLISLNPPPPATQPISNPNTTATASAPPSPPHLISPSQSDRPILSFNPFDLESGNQTPPVLAANQNDAPPDWKRTGKVVQVVGLSGFGASVTLLVNAPASATTHHVLYAAYLAVVCLGMITSISLSIFSIIMKGSPVVGWVQKKLIYFTLSFVVFACFLRLQLALPLADVGFGTVPVLIGLVIIALYLLIGSKNQRQTQETGDNH